jgi:TRAP-type mannitol/chloroaromatic compound transport system permease small subunit
VETQLRVISGIVCLLTGYLTYRLGTSSPLVWTAWIISGAAVITFFLAPVLLPVAEVIDWVNEQIGKVCDWLVLVACVVSAGNAMVRYAYDTSSNAWLEIQWYMFAIMVMFGAAYTLKKNEHVRVDIVYMVLSERGQLWVDVMGTLFFLLPACVLLTWLSWPFFMQSFNVFEHSSNAGGLLRWPIKLVLPVGFAMVALQGFSELIKRVASLEGLKVEVETKYERPLQ